MATRQLPQAAATHDDPFLRVLDGTSDAVFLLDEQGAITYANETASRLLGIPAEDLRGRWALEFVHRGDLVRARRSFERLLEHWERSITTQVRCGRRGGPYVHLDVTAVNRLNDARAGAIVTHARDVTAREHARSRLTQSEGRYRTIIEQLPVVAYTATLDEPSVLLYVSPQIEALLGYTPDEFWRNDGIWPEGIHADDRARVMAELRSCAATGKPFASEYRFLRRDGAVIWLRDEGRVVPGSNGTPLCLQGVMQDITDRKHAEGQLAEAQAFAHVGSWEWDLVADRIAWSDEHFRIFGLEPQSYPVTYEWTLRFVHPADHATLKRTVAQALADCRPYGCEFRVLRPDGAERLVEARGTVEVDATGRPVRAYGTAQDVTDRRRADEALHRSQQEFRDIFDYASVGIFRSSRDGRILLANSAFARMLGYDSPEELRTLSLVRDVYVDPEERDAHLKRYEPRPEGWTFELQWKKRDGTPFWVLLSAHAVKDAAGRTQYFEAFVQDITAQRQSSQELARSRRRLRQLAARLEEVRERDRKVIAREIHDQLGQALTALRMDISWILGRLPARRAGLAEKARAMVGVVDQWSQ